jgi:NitT/TauT family transport system ATP-binding protein
MNMNNQKALIKLEGVSKSFRTSDGTKRSVLEDVNFQLQDGEIVALLGKSGSGKSTLLRIIAGLISADQGSVEYCNQQIYGPVSGIAMVFQSFALFPWLTVQQNVELGLEAQGVPAAEREERADAVLELIGLSGFGGALPRELSGGMRQRVGIARALVTNPDILLMDEAFSALDVLTGETLRDDMLELWQEKRITTKGIVIVSHNIAEAVMMADRILLLSSDPPQPRDIESPEVRALIDKVYAMMTMQPQQAAATQAAATQIGYRLPPADVARMEGLMELLNDAPFEGRADLPQLAEEAELSDVELFPTYEALSLLELVQVEEGDITFTALGRRYIDGEQALRQDIFNQQLLKKVPLVALIKRELDAEPSGALPERQFLEVLEEHMKKDEAERVLGVAIEWGRYGEIYEYDFHTGKLTLPGQE